MIEINLLPPQYRSVERTPLPVFVGLILGVLLIAGAGVMIFRAGDRTRELRNQRELQESLLVKAIDDEKRFDDLVRSIQDDKGRINTVLAIAESKIPWALKLEQLVETIPSQTVWIDSLTAEASPDGSGQITFATNARGVSLEKATQFKQKLRQNTNFFLHFESIDPLKAKTVASGAEYIEPEYLSFQTTLRLRREERGRVKKGKGK
ncbi:MAG: hypothetical protein ACYS22_17145 [Planctomycetota bacterium]|jgi:Tfp pilus assembly protein PilN